MRLINFSAANCKNCYKCVRFCPVKAIRYANDQAEIDEDRCVACGQCFVVCPQNARNIKSNIEIVQAAIRCNKEVVACIAPAFAGFFENPKAFISALRVLGFSNIQEVAASAEQVSKNYDKFIQIVQPKYAISSCCTTVNLLIRRYYPSLTQYLIPTLSPMLALGKAIKAESPDCFTVFIGPCISKKCEAVGIGNEKYIDAVLTFEEVITMFDQKNIQLDTLPDAIPDRTANPIGQKYPISGGIGIGFADTINALGYDRIHIEGLNNAKLLLDALRDGQLGPAYIEISSCVESCIAGPGIPKSAKNIYVRKQALKKFIHTGWQENAPYPPIDWNKINISTCYFGMENKGQLFSETQIHETLKQMGKNCIEDQLDCGACGYNSCREKAYAVLEGMSQVEMCMPFMQSRAEHMKDLIFMNSPNLIFVLDKTLHVLQINPAAEYAFQVKATALRHKPIQTLFDSDYFNEVLSVQNNLLNKKVHYPRYGLVVIENIIYLQRDEQLLIIMSDITDEERRKTELARVKENTLDIAQNVINKQMRVAQEIASLLGETTAETKVALNKLKDLVLKEGES